jgi:hypothetical protein
VEIKLTQKEKETFAREAFQNFPEASMGSDLRCIGWSYGDKSKVFKFAFYDVGEDKEHVIGLKEACEGVDKFFELKSQGCLGGFRGNILDTGDYDTDDFDAIAQLACLGKIIYG